MTAALLAGTALPALARPVHARRPGPCLVPGTGQPLDRIWRPDVRSAIAYVHARAGEISFAVRTAHRFYGYRPDTPVPAASVLKAMLLVAYLDRPSVRDRPLASADFALLVPMIEWSDSVAATTVRDIVGDAALYAVAQAAHMTRFAAAPIWGLSQVTARDQTKLFLDLDRFVAPRHRWYALHLLASIVPAQRWGVGKVRHRGWTLYFKGGWGSGTGAVDHQVALLRRGCARIAVAVMTVGDGSHAYGQETLRGLFARLLRRLPA